MIDLEPDDWLPPGWIVKGKNRNNGKLDKFYFSPSGERFNSKIGVCRHLGLDPKTIGASQQSITPCVQSNSSIVASSLTTEASTPKTPRKTISPKLKPVAQSTPSENEVSLEQGRGGNGDYLPGKVYFERVPADGLPPGWTKDVKIQNTCGKIRRDAFFTDPVSGYVFRSMKDTLRYIATGDPGRLAFKPKSPLAAEPVKVVGNRRKRRRSETTPARKDLRVNDYIGQSQGEGNGRPPGFGANLVSHGELGSGELSEVGVPPVQFSVGSGSTPKWVRGTDRSLFR